MPEPRPSLSELLLEYADQADDDGLLELIARHYPDVTAADIRAALEEDPFGDLPGLALRTVRR